MLPQIKKILYATDLKEKGSDEVFRMVVSLAKSNDAQVYILHVMESISSSVEGILRNSMSDEEIEGFKTSGYNNLKASLEKSIHDFCERECPEGDKNYPGGTPIALVVEGEPDQVILKQAQEQQADLIVMGTRTHTGIGQILLGSTANKVIHHSKIPVMVYPM